MHHSGRGRWIAGAALGVVVALAAPGVALADDIAVDIVGSEYQTESVTVHPGNSVFWYNRDGIAHTATSDTGGWDTGEIAPGGNESVRFDELGDFPYHCVYHPDMQGTVHVVPEGAEASPTDARGDGGMPNTTTAAGNRPPGPLHPLAFVLAATAALNAASAAALRAGANRRR
jgi:plastocyanin